MAADEAYLDGLKLLARRELSEAQVHAQLSRRGHAADAVDIAVTRLKQERAIDDERVAGAIARTEVRLKQRGPQRVRQKIEASGIATATAQRAVEAAFAEIDEDVLIQTALKKRLPDEAWIETDAAFERLGRYLAAQGFEEDRILRLLAARRRRP